MKYKYIFYIIIVILIILNINSIYKLFTHKKNYPLRFKETKQEEFLNKDNIEFVLYIKENCGLCDKMNSIFNKIYDDYKECDMNINGCRIENKIIKFRKINCDDEENSCFNIDRYPLFVLNINENIKVYNGDYNIINFDLLMQWLKNEIINLNKKKPLQE